CEVFVPSYALSGYYKDLIHRGMPKKRQFRFVYFHPVTPNFHLRILAPEMFETAVGGQSPPLPCAKNTIRPTVWISSIYGSGKIRFLPIAGREVPTSDGYFTDLADTQLVTGFIQ